MANDEYQYQFGEVIPMPEVESSLLLAVLAIECLHGRESIHMDAVFRLDQVARECVVDASTDVGCSIARVFTGFLAREFGERSFTVRRIGHTHKEGHDDSQLTFPP